MRSESGGEMANREEAAESWSVEFAAPRSAHMVSGSVDMSDIGPHEVVVRARRSVISPGTELAWYRGQSFAGTSPRRAFPLRPGYAMAGTVLRAGVATGLEADMTVLSYTPHSSVVRFDKANVVCVPIEGDLALAAVPFARLVQVGGISLLASAARPGDVVVVMGLGPVGNLVAQLAACSGFVVVGVEPSEQRRRIAADCGLRTLVSLDDAESAVERLGGARVVLECSGSPSALLLATALCARYGEILTVGAPWGAETSVHVNAVMAGVFEKFLAIRSGWEWQWPRYDDRTGRSVESCAQWVLRRLSDNSIVTAPLVTDTIGPDEMPEAYRRLDSHPDENLTFLVDWER